MQKEQPLRMLYSKVDRCSFCRGEKNKLQHIHGFGAIKPELMLILINPTYRNISSSPDYVGPRFPFIGVRQFWKVLGNAGLIDASVSGALPLRQAWNMEHTRALQKELLENKLFLTNIVKCCYDHPQYPSAEVISSQLGFLKEEIELVQPKRIVAFSGLVFKTLTDQSIKLSEYWNSGRKKSYQETVSTLSVPVIPCYFPIGRGNPSKAVSSLQSLD